ncbi:MAG TPA: hypothetical protein VFN42_03145 [Acetobacteraceae bacterium]|nr:hypothetical protein [Acetobacteraceae bacterium]
MRQRVTSATGVPSDGMPRVAAHRAAAVLLGSALLLWPALYNGYPLVFADTGTYLSQAIERYLGWDRPVFYSLFLLPLHLTLTTWPVIAAQALLTGYTLHLLQQVLLPGSRALWLVPLLAGASLATALPWFAAQLMPDVFTPLLVLALAMLVCTPARLTAWQRRWLMACAACLIAAQHSSVPLAFLLLLALPPLRVRLAGGDAPNRRDWLRLAAPPLLAVLLLVAVNLAGQRRLAIAPYGNVFLLARVIYDGPGLHALQQDCPNSGWRLCAWRDRLPPTSDDFLWRPDSPAIRIGGHKALSAEADAIIASALRREPGAEARAILHNLRRQLGSFATGDGLHAWPDAVGRWMARDFPPREQAAYATARQSRNRLVVPGWMQSLHAATGLAGVAGCVILLAAGLYRPHPAAGFAAAVLLALLFNAVITGGLSAPHDRYQSRVMLLPPLVTVLGGAALLRDRWSVA